MTRRISTWDPCSCAPATSSRSSSRLRVRTGRSALSVLVKDDSALELRAFAATRSGGLWDEVRDDLILEVARLDGTSEQVTGPFGEELLVRVPVELPDGEEGFQPSRIVGVEGPRWLLRATFLGEAASTRATMTCSCRLSETSSSYAVTRRASPANHCC